MPTTKHGSVRLDSATLERLRALSVLVNRPVADVCRTLSFADLSVVLDCTARRAIADQPAEVRAAWREAAERDSRGLDNAGARGNE